MKKLDWTAVTASNGLVFEEQTFEHMNNGHKDSYISFVKANIPSAMHTGKLVILYGCVDSGTHPARNLSAGAVYYNGEIYQVDAASFTTTGLQIGIWTLVDVDSGSTESTIKTATSSFLSHVLVNSKFVFAAGLSGTGTFDESSSNVVFYQKLPVFDNTEANIIDSLKDFDNSASLTSANTWKAINIGHYATELYGTMKITVSSGLAAHLLSETDEVSQVYIKLKTGYKSSVISSQLTFTGNSATLAPPLRRGNINILSDSSGDLILQIARLDSTITTGEILCIYFSCIIEH